MGSRIPHPASRARSNTTNASPRGKESICWLQSTKARHNGRAGRKGLWFRARPVGPANRARACCAAAAESGNINETLKPAADKPERTEERRVGEECVSPGKAGGWADKKQKKK